MDKLLDLINSILSPIGINIGGGGGSSNSTSWTFKGILNSIQSLYNEQSPKAQNWLSGNEWVKGILDFIDAFSDDTNNNSNANQQPVTNDVQANENLTNSDDKTNGENQTPKGLDDTEKLTHKALENYGIYLSNKGKHIEAAAITAFTNRIKETMETGSPLGEKFNEAVKAHQQDAEIDLSKLIKLTDTSDNTLSNKEKAATILAAYSRTEAYRDNAKNMSGKEIIQKLASTDASATPKQ